VTLEIHTQPGAKSSEISGVHGDCLRVRVAAPAVEGKANAALIAHLAEAFGVPKRGVTIVRGETARRKTVRITQPRLRRIGWWPRYAFNPRRPARQRICEPHEIRDRERPARPARCPPARADLRRRSS
jgi:uncharacterized protein (TIGR00251 family)